MVNRIDYDEAIAFYEKLNRERELLPHEVERLDYLVRTQQGIERIRKSRRENPDYHRRKRSERYARLLREETPEEREARLEAQREAVARYRAKNREKLNAKRREYGKKNREQETKRAREYRTKNPDVIREACRRYRQRQAALMKKSSEGVNS